MTEGHNPPDPSRLTVLHGKFAAYLAWSQPFIHDLVTGLERFTNGVVICNRTENLDRFPPPRIQRIDRSYLVIPSRAALVANRLRLDFHPDLMHAHFGWSGLRMLMLKQMLRIPLVTTFGGRDASVQMHHPAFAEVYRVLLDASEQIVCVSSDLRSQLRAAGVPEERIAVVHRGTHLQNFRFVDRSDRPTDTDVRILMVGRLVEKKGHAYAIEAVRQLVERGANVQLTIVGEGEEYARLRRLRRDGGLGRRVTLLPPTDHDGVRQHLSAADVFLHCSVTGSDGDTEGIPNVVVEAAATGLPVVGTYHGGIIEPVRHGETGLLVKERNVAELVDALDDLVRDRARRLEMGRAGRRFMASDFDVEKQIRAYVEIYERLVADFRNKPELRETTWLPERFDRQLEAAMRPTGHAVEFSVSELFEELTAPSDFDRRALPREPGALARLYELKRYVPYQIKFPLKYLMREVLVPMIRLRSRVSGAEIVDPRADLDDVLMRYIRAGGDVETLLAGYRFSSMPHAKAYLSHQLAAAGMGNTDSGS